VLIRSSIPSPTFSQFDIGPLTIHAYALSILLGILVAVLVTQRRWSERGGGVGEVADIATWAVPAGIIGGRIYHVISSPQRYFGAGGDPLEAFAIWKGGLGIWGAISLGAVGAWWGHRRLIKRRSARSLPTPPFAAFADALVPGLLLAQAIGRWGNWFNIELFGRPTDLPWGLEVPPAFRPDPSIATYHPTFLYESLWCLVAAAILVVLERRFQIGNGRLFLLYVAFYSFGRFWIELLRIDSANTIAGFRVNSWVSGILVLLALILFARRARTSRSEPTVNQEGEAHE
jgi:prolipoprotein diacylglyceryl transferase